MSVNKKVLLLNNDYSVIQPLPYKKALTLYFKGVVKVVSYYEDTHILDTKGRQHMIPAVIILNKYVKRIRKEVAFSRKNLFARDAYQCAYCGNKFPCHLLTVEHIIPVSIWRKQNHKGRSPTSLKTCVTACVSCNRKKANRTPKQAQMPLLYQPRQPKYNEVIVGIQYEDSPEEWKPYLTSMRN